MDGYTLTDKMRKARRRFRFTATEQALFYELVAVCNGEDWRDVFDCSNVELCCALNINEKTLAKARETLINADLIYYKSGKSKRAVSSYSFEKPFKTADKTTVNNTVDKGINKGTNKWVDKGTNSTDSYKHKTKPNSSHSPVRIGELFPSDEVFDKSLNECYQELKSNQTWIDIICMNTRTAYKEFTPDKFYEYLSLFFIKLQNEGETTKSAKDAMSHFARWLQIELKNRKYETKTNKNGNSNGIVASPIDQGSKYTTEGSNPNTESLKDWVNSLSIGQ